MKELKIYKDEPFKPHKKINFSVIEEFELKKHNAEFMEISGSFITNGNFNETNFYGVSFLSTKFSNIEFKNCNLSGTDICSIWMKKCTLIKSNLSNSTISDSMFIDCIFDEDSFESVTLTNSHFINCTINSFPLDDSTVTLNYFINCTIKKTHFTESFHYQIFENCKFEEINMNPELLGYNFGFSKESIDNISNTSNIELIKNRFVKNQLLINAAILSINQLGNYYDLAMLGCISAMCQMMRQDILVKNDEIQFLRKITEYLEKNNLISEFIQIKIWHCLNLLLEGKESNVAISRALPYIQEFSNMLYFKFQNFQQELDKEINNFGYISQENYVEVQITYKIAPAIQLLSLLETFRGNYLPNAKETKLVLTKQGSFIEILKMAEPLLPYLKAFLTILGTATPFILYGLNKRDKKKEKEEKYKNDKKENKGKVNISNNTIISQNIYQFNNILIPNVAAVSSKTEDIIKSVTTIINASEIGCNSDFCGYNPNNIDSVIIRYKDNDD